MINRRKDIWIFLFALFLLFPINIKQLNTLIFMGIHIVPRGGGQNVPVSVELLNIRVI